MRRKDKIIPTRQRRENVRKRAYPLNWLELGEQILAKFQRILGKWQALEIFRARARINQKRDNPTGQKAAQMGLPG